MATNIPWDVVALTLKAEREMQAETVRVFVSGNLLLAGEDTGKSKAALAEALSKVIDGKWALTTARRGEDPSGMERVSVAASIRVKEHLTAGLTERLKQASRAGLQLQLSRIVTRPPKAEMDAVIAELRQELYEKARTEADLLNRLLPADEGTWRIGGIQFDQTTEEDEHRARQTRQEFMSLGINERDGRGDSSGEQDLAVSTKIVLLARVELKRLSVAAPEGGFFH
ncbi:MAG: hypothetical protein JSR77_10750 [Planctomycetes bacterium]|nr:hypothetical protein [Planctomycetota bacterium]